MMEHHSISKARKMLLLSATPPIAKKTYALLQQIKTLGEDGLYKQCVSHWFAAFRRCILNYREIGKQIKVINSEGKSCALSLKGVINNTSILDDFDLEMDDQGEYMVYLDSKYWREYSIEKRSNYSEECYLQWPHTDQITKVSQGQSPKQAAINHLRNERIKYSSNKKLLSALNGLEEIVKMTGLTVWVSGNSSTDDSKG